MKNSKRSLVILALAVPALLFAYTNCGQFKSIGELTSYASQACIQSLRSTAKVSFAASICEDDGAFACDRRVFRPGVGSDVTHKMECVKLDGRESCVSVTTHNFDTEAARDGAAPGAFEEGGDYNRDEVQCINTKVIAHAVAVIEADTSDLATSLSSAREKCRSRGEK